MKRLRTYVWIDGLLILLIILVVVALAFAIMTSVGAAPNETVVEPQQETPVPLAVESTPEPSEEPIVVEEPVVSEEPVVVEEVEPYYYLSDEERAIVEKMVMGEAGTEGFDGQVLVAQCIVNAAMQDGITPSEVRVKYKYAGWHEEPSETVKQAVSAVFDEGYKLTDEFILWFYAPKYSAGKFHNTQRFVLEYLGHRFYAPWE